MASALAAEKGHHRHTSYLHGDLVDLSTTLEPADIVVLDKVVCCYANPTALLEKSSAITRRHLALSYPRAALGASLGFRFLSWLGRSLRWSFHPYYHRPSLLEATIARMGFREVFSGTTMIWQLKIYERP